MMASDKIPGAISPKKHIEALKKCENCTEEDIEKLRFLYNIDETNDVYYDKDGIVLVAFRDPQYVVLSVWDLYYDFKRWFESDYPNADFTIIKKEFPMITQKSEEEKQLEWSDYIFVIKNIKELFQIEPRHSLGDIENEKKELEKKRQTQLEEIKSACFGFKGTGFKDCGLKGAISADSLFTYIWMYDGDAVSDYSELFVSEKSFKKDLDNNIFVNENGAVLNAYDFKDLDDETKEMAIEYVIEQYQQQYPNYQLTVKEGEFPIEVRINQYRGEYETKSTHILYVTNYKDCLTPINQKTSKR